MTRKFTKSELRKFVRITATPFIQDEINKAIAPLLEPVDTVGIADIIYGTRNGANTESKPGHGLTNIIRGLALGGVAGAQKAAEPYGSGTEVKALAAGNLTGGGVMVQGQLAQEIIDLLKRAVAIAPN